jgi:Fibronectin type III domain
MKHVIASVAALVLFLSIAVVRPCSASPITVQIVNNSGVTDPNVYLLLTGNSVSASGITPDVSTQLSLLTNKEFTLSAISAGRLIFSYNGAVAYNQPPAVSSHRFDKVEMTYPGAANLTAVDFFGIPFKLETLDSSGNVLQALTYYTSADSLAAKLEALAPDAEVMTPAGDFARVLSPSQKPSAYSSLEDYVDSVAGKKVNVNGTYVGQVGPSPNTYSYSGTFGRDGTITLSGTMSQVAVPNSQPLTIEGTTLASAIFTNNGPYTVATASNNPQMVSNDDVYAAIYRDLVAGFDFGYVGGKYGNNSAKWYETTPYNPPYACARRTIDGYYNQYASIIAANSDAYGFPFSDRLQPVQVALNPGAVNDVAKLRITILPDDMLDAPKIQSTVVTANSIKLKWNAISGATDYTVNVSPPLPAQSIDAGTADSYTINGLNSGTPYTVSVTASNGISTSEAIPEVVSTQGTAKKISGTVGWHFIAFFTGTFSGDQVTFNGQTKTLPSVANPSLAWNSPMGAPGQTNAYVFNWKHVSAANHTSRIYKSILYVTFASTPSTGLGSIDEAAANTFMSANQNLPTYDMTGFNLYLSVAPTVQRTLCVRPEPLQLLGGAHHPPHDPH